MRVGDLHRIAVAIIALGAFALSPALAGAAPDSRGSTDAPAGTPWRLVAVAPDTGCVVVRRQAEVRRLCQGDALDGGTRVELVAIEALRARFRVDVTGSMPLELTVARGAPIDLARTRQAQDAAAPRPRWVTDGGWVPEDAVEADR